MSKTTPSSGADVPMSPPVQRQWSVWLALALAVLVLVGVPLIRWLPLSPAMHSPTVEVADQAGVFGVEQLTAELREVKFRTPVHLEVLSFSELPTGNLNDEVLAFARSGHAGVALIDPADPRYFSPGTVILAVAPHHRLVGTYFGEDVSVPLNQQSAIQEAAKDDFRAAQWDKGIVQAATKAAELIDQPWVRTDAARIVGIIACILAGLVAGWIVIRRVWAASNWTKARRTYARVTADFDATEIAAGTIPRGDAHGAQVLARFAAFEDHYHDLTRAFTAVGTPSAAAMWTAGAARTMDQLAKAATDLDDLDDSIVHASDLLTCSGKWWEAWLNETGPLREDISTVLSLIDAFPLRLMLEAERLEAQRVVNGWDDLIDILGAKLQDGEITGSAALDALDELAGQIRTYTLAMIRDVLDADTKSGAEKRRAEFEKQAAQVNRDAASSTSALVYTGRWARGGHRYSYNPRSTVRPHVGSPDWAVSWAPWMMGSSTQVGEPWSSGSRAGAGAWSTGSGSASSFVPIAGLVTGYSAATGSGSSGSGSGSSGGFSGGGFSGSGSSSSF